jgi:hypothetical protein
MPRGKLTPLELLGVGAYSIGALGLVYTSITHFTIIYRLLLTFTTLINLARG